LVAIETVERKMRIIILALCLLPLLGGVEGTAHETHARSLAAATPFDIQMAEAMSKMDAGMMAARPTGEPNRDFLAMMIPHHQGAVDMARAILLTTHDPRVRNLAEGVIAEQQVEIQQMQLLLATMDAPTDETAVTRKE
jgi:uncharacterized protein (DUF305 family)